MHGLDLSSLLAPTLGHGADDDLLALAAARSRGRHGGRPYKMISAKLRLVMAAMADVETNVGDLCRELGVTGWARRLPRPIGGLVPTWGHAEP